jgi:hypothetical protein
MRRVFLATLLIVPLWLSGACSEDPVAAPSVATDDAGGGAETGTVVDGGDAGRSTPRDGGAFDAGPCTCNDGDASTIDLCPVSSSCAYFALGEASPTVLSGIAGGSTFAAACPGSSFLIGVSASINQGAAPATLGEVAFVCGSPRISTSTYPYVIDFPTTELPDAGAIVGGTTKVCPGMGAVRGFEGRGTTGVEKFVARCGTVTLVSPAVNELKLSVTASADKLEFGGETGDVFAPVDCPDGAVATGVYGKSDGNILSIGLLCSAASIQYE